VVPKEFVSVDLRRLVNTVLTFRQTYLLDETSLSSTNKNVLKWLISENNEEKFAPDVYSALWICGRRFAKMGKILRRNQISEMFLSKQLRKCLSSSRVVKGLPHTYKSPLLQRLEIRLTRIDSDPSTLSTSVVFFLSINHNDQLSLIFILVVYLFIYFFTIIIVSYSIPLSCIFAVALLLYSLRTSR
jgi:hypothetical protein